MTLLTKLDRILKGLEEPTDINEILEQLNIEYSNINVRNLTSAIRLAGYEVKSTASWNKENSKTIRRSMIQPK